MGPTLPSLTMRKLIVLMMLAFPVHAFAAMDTASDVLSTTAFTGSPRSFELQAHNQKSGVYYSAWVKGSEEGKGEWYKAKMDVTTHMQNGNDSKKMNIRIMVYQHMLYAAIIDGDNTKWTSMPIGDLSSAHGFSVYQLLEKAGIDILNITPALTEVVHNANHLLSVNHEGYAGGNAYSLKTSSPEHNTHIRINTDTLGRFGYAKIYTTNGYFVAQGSTQPQNKALYLGVPQTTISYDHFKGLLEAFRVRTTPEDTSPTIEIQKNERVTTSRSNRIVHADRSRATPREIPTECGITGTIERVELERKGFCPTQRLHKRILHGNDEPGRNGRSIWKARVETDQRAEAYNTISEEVENNAKRRNMHAIKAMISRTTLQMSGSKTINDWITGEIIPFFTPTGRSWIVESVLLEDEYGNSGIALQKSTTTSTGKRKNFIIFLVEEDEGDEPVMTDIFFHTRLSDLRAEGLID